MAEEKKKREPEEDVKLLAEALKARPKKKE